MPPINFVLERLKAEFGESYANTLWRDVVDNVKQYGIYDGAGQVWETKNQDYTPTKRIINHIAHLIKEENRHMFARAPEITINPVGDDEKNKERCKALENWLRRVLEDSGWQAMLPKAGRDACIGKRVTLKLTGGPKQPIRVGFRPALESFSDSDPEDSTRIERIVFLYSTTPGVEEPAAQRYFFQKYYMENGRCKMDEIIYNGFGSPVEERRKGADTGLDCLPAYTIINDGLTGDPIGESDVADLWDCADAYNHLTSDDQDALKFNMFPQRVFEDASEDSLAQIKIAPGAMIDLQTDPAAIDRQAKYGMLEAGFNYDARLENHLKRIKSDMYALMCVPEGTPEDYKAMGISGKAMRALYWKLTSRCEEKWASWDTALKWMVHTLEKMAVAYGQGAEFAGADYTVTIEHLYPIMDDEEEERELDLREVAQKARSIKSYVEKWQPNTDADGELKQIAQERAMLEEYYGR